MELSEVEKEKFKTMIMYAIGKKTKASGGHSGFSIYDLQFLLTELEQEGKIVERPIVSSTYLSKHYFLKENTL